MGFLLRRKLREVLDATWRNHFSASIRRLPASRPYDVDPRLRSYWITTDVPHSLYYRKDGLMKRFSILILVVAIMCMVCAMAEEQLPEEAVNAITAEDERVETDVCATPEPEGSGTEDIATTPEPEEAPTHDDERGDAEQAEELQVAEEVPPEELEPEQEARCSVNEFSITLDVGESYTIPTGCAASYKFSSSKSSIASVGKTSGIITAKKAGSAIITAKSSYASSIVYRVTVKGLPSGTISGYVGNVLTFDTAGYSQSFTVSGSKYVEVDKRKNSLRIKCLTGGTAKITLYSTYNSRIKSTITIKIKVEKKCVSSHTYTLKYGDSIELRYSDLGFSNKYDRYSYECSNRYLDFFSTRRGKIILKLVTPKKQTLTLKLYKYDDYGNYEYCTIKLKCTV